MFRGFGGGCGSICLSADAPVLPDLLRDDEEADGARRHRGRELGEGVKEGIPPGQHPSDTQRQRHGRVVVRPGDVPALGEEEIGSRRNAEV